MYGDRGAGVQYRAAYVKVRFLKRGNGAHCGTFSCTHDPQGVAVDVKSRERIDCRHYCRPTHLENGWRDALAGYTVWVSLWRYHRWYLSLVDGTSTAPLANTIHSTPDTVPEAVVSVVGGARGQLRVQ